MARETQRERAERIGNAQEYFVYGAPQWRNTYWLDPKLHSMKLEEVLCDECPYVPRYDSTQPRRAYRAHVKKHHPSTWFKDYAKPFVIQEEEDFDAEAELAALRELLYA